MPVFHSKRFAVTTTAHMPPNKYSSNQTPAPCSAVARPKRRRAKANNDPGFKFIITNDPKEFKNKDNKKEVRSQAMRNHRWKDRNENSLAALALIAQSPPDSPQHEPVESLRVFSYNGLEQNEQYLDLPMPTIEQQHTSAPAVQSTFHTTAYDTALTNESCRTSESRVTGYEAAGGHQSFMVDMLLDDFAQHHSDFLADDGQIGVLPMISSLESSTEYLLFMLKREFTTASTLRKWFPAICSDRDLISSATVLAAAWDDMQNNLPGESERTSLLKRETAAMLDRRLENPNTHLDETTIKVILHLMSAEMWNCHEDMLRRYETDVARTIHTRGGVHRLRDRTVAEFAVAYSYHSAITHEATQYAVFQEWRVPSLPRDDMASLPESPLFCLGGDFAMASTDSHCSIAIRNILCSMRDLTDLFIAYAEPLTDQCIKEDEEDEEHRSLAIFDYNDKSSAIRALMLSLPSAEEQGHPSSGDWVYEACRIAAVIHTEAIVELEPFSKIGDPRYSSGSLSNTGWTSTYRTTRPSPSKSLPEKLSEALGKTDCANIWSDMAGVLYWVCVVGAAAARTPAGMDNGLQSMTCNGQQSYPIWVRRSLAMHATRTMVILVALHPMPTIMAQRKLYRIQELIRAVSHT